MNKTNYGEELRKKDELIKSLTIGLSQLEEMTISVMRADDLTDERDALKADNNRLREAYDKLLSSLNIEPIPIYALADHDAEVRRKAVEEVAEFMDHNVNVSMTDGDFIRSTFLESK